MKDKDEYYKYLFATRRTPSWTLKTIKKDSPI